jgi:hypothetical protein
MNGTCGKIPVLNGGSGSDIYGARYILGRRNFLLAYIPHIYILQMSYLRLKI